MLFKFGDVVYHDDYEFKDNIKDEKKNRPCIVLFSTVDDTGEYVCTCPLTTSVKSFNKKPNNYILLSESVYNYKKLCFVKLLDTSLIPISKTHYTGITLNEDETTRVLNSIINRYITNKDDIKTQKYLMYLKLFIELDNKEKKAAKKLYKKRNYINS